MYLPRTLERAVEAWFASPLRILTLYGPRQAGKTTMLRNALASYSGRVVQMDADRYAVREELSSGDFARLSGLVNGKDILFIDEAQRVPDIGINLKILHDGIPGLRIIATGSSSFELAQKTGESLAGRAMSMTLLPLSVREVSTGMTRFELDEKIEGYLRFGMYPGLLAVPGDDGKADALIDLVDSALYKDILALGGVRNERVLRDLVRLLAFQAGSEVSATELGTSLGISKNTVDRYIDLLEKTFVVFRLQGFSRNLRNEVSRKSKVFFWDNGIRNAVIENFKPLSKRDDRGRLWENFIIAERLKMRLHERRRADTRFWRSHSGGEIDLVEDEAGDLRAWEIKSGDRTARVPPSWGAAYPGAAFATLNQSNWQEFLGVSG